MTNKIFAVTLALVSVLQLIQAECPNGCSGAGTCSAKDMCKCFKNYEGNDCSLRTCPFGNAHVDSPKGDLDNSATLDNSLVIISEQFPEGAYEYRNPTAVADEGHFYAECSNRGICGRETGDCACFEGYDGSACQRTSCLNNCNGKGTCESIKEFATDRNGKLFHTSPKTQNDAIYSLWDAKSSYGCKCDPGFFGPDCSLRHCKVGVDPMYEAIRSEVHETIAIYLAAGTLSSVKHFRIRFFDYWGESFITKRIMSGSGSTFLADTVTNIAAALKALPNGVVDDVTCELEGATTFLTFLTKVNTKPTIGCQFLKNAGKLRLPEIVSDSDSTNSINYSTEDIKITRTMMVGEDAEPTGLKSALIVKSSDASALTLTTTDTALSFELPVSTTNAILLKVDEYYAVATNYLNGVFTTVTSLPDIAADPNVNYGPVYYSPTPGHICDHDGVVSMGNTDLTFTTSATYNDGSSKTIAVGDALFIKHAFYIAIAVAGISGSNQIVTIDRPFYGIAATTVVGEIYVWPGGIPTTNEMTYVSECSGRGLCDHGSNGENGGVCQCFPGYTNDNCDTQNILAF